MAVKPETDPFFITAAHESLIDTEILRDPSPTAHSKAKTGAKLSFVFFLHHPSRMTALIILLNESLSVMQEWHGLQKSSWMGLII